MAEDPEKENPDPKENPDANEEEPPAPPPKIQPTPEMLTQGLSQLTRNFDGTSFTYGKFIAEVF